MEAEPSPRWGHYSTRIGEKVYTCGGRTRDYLQSKGEIASSVHSFDQLLEFWAEERCSGVHPPGLYDGACASVGHHLYVYGGGDESNYHGSLYQLDVESLTWKCLSRAGPMKKDGCRMVTYDGNLVLFGGYGGPPSSLTQPGTEFIKGKDNSWWTNELHTFNLKKGRGLYLIEI
jgi:N-acetylneuraminic acid mutarotase